jgi:hypothetical protein
MYTKELIQEIHHSLSPELLELIASDSTIATIEEVAVKEDFSVDQMKKIEKILSYRLMGLIPTENFAENIQKEVGVEKDVALRVVASLTKDVLTKVTSDALMAQENNAKNILSKQNTIHNTLPVVEEGEKVHDVPHDTKLDMMPKPAPAVATPVVTAPPAPAPAPTGEKVRPHSDTPVPKEAPKIPNPHYPGGADPYREPLN